MEYIYRRRGYKAEYKINGNKMFMKDGYLWPTIEIDLASGDYSIREGLILHQGIFIIAAAALLLFGVAISSCDSESIYERLLFVYATTLPLSVGLFIFAYLRFGFLLTGMVLRFPNGDKVNVIKNKDNLVEYNQFVDQIKAIKVGHPPA